MDTAATKAWAATLKALGHPTRLRIVVELLQGTKCVTDIHEILPASQANISQHLAVLRHADLVDCTQEGAQRCYYLTRPDLVQGVVDLLATRKGARSGAKGRTAAGNRSRALRA
jgi:DNA-binding transcriptional ArsR family regulator